MVFAARESSDGAYVHRIWLAEVPSGGSSDETGSKFNLLLKRVREFCAFARYVAIDHSVPPSGLVSDFIDVPESKVGAALIPNFTGVGRPYEPPAFPGLRLVPAGCQDSAVKVCLGLAFA